MKYPRRSFETPAPSVRAGFAKRPLVAALAAGFVTASGSAWAQLPTGAAVVNGTAGIATKGGAMTITNSPNAIVNWKTFSIGTQNSVRFEQQSATSQVLNRVVGNDPSSILGSLSSNGGVWLVNPNGVLFGANARIDVAGLVASTLAITNDDFLGRRFRFETASPAGGQVLNQGEINTTFGGRVWLMGDSVRNEGLVKTPGGNIVLAAGKSIELVDSGMPNVTVRVTAPQNEAVNLGTLIATAGGSIDVHGGIVNQQGIVRADSVGMDAAGRVVIKAQGDVTLGDSSVTSARSQGTGAGGRIVVASAAGTTSVAGQVDATSTDGKGGQIQLLGTNVGLFNQAQADASGAAGGGEVLVGGDYQGGNPEVANARAAYLGPDASVRANATKAGDGGKVILWGTDVARAYGTIEAKGGPAAGNGGLIETSGSYLDAQPKSIQVGAPAGAAGTWLLDPNDITIGVADNQSTYAAGNGVFTSTSDNSVISASQISNQLDQGTNVLVRTGSGGANSQAGNIVVASNIAVTGSSVPVLTDGSFIQTIDILPGSLTLQAHNNITINAGVKIESTGGPMPVTLTANSDGVNGGGIRLANFITLGVTIRTGGGNIVMSGAGLSTAPGDTQNTGIEITGAILDAGAGNLTLRGVGRNDGKGILITGFVAGGDIGNIRSTLTARDIDIQGQAITASGVEIALTDLRAQGGLSLSGSSANVFGNSQLQAAGPISVTTAGVTSLANAGLLSSATGNAITIVPGRFSNTAGQLSAPNGRWLIAATSGQNVSTFATDFAGLDYAFVQFNAPVGSAPAVSGIGQNGVLLSDPLNVQVKTNATRPYDGTVRATFDNFLSSDAPAGFAVQTLNPGVAVEGAFQNKNAGVDKPISFGGQKFIFQTSDGRPVFGNTLSYSGDITARTITATGITAANKIYDATRAATFTGSLSGIVPGDDATLSGAIGLFDDKNAGTNKLVTISGGTLAGADRNNYVLSGAATARADITPKPLTIGITGLVSKEYDATTAASLAPEQFALNGVIANDVLSVRGPVQGSYGTANVGTQKSVSAAGAFQISGADARNYSVAATNLTSATVNVVSAAASGNVGTITPATLTYNADPAVREVGLPIAGLTGTVSGFKGADTIGSATSGLLDWRTSATVESPPGTYAVNGIGLSAGNYVFTQAPGNATALALLPTNRPEAPQQQAVAGSTSAVGLAQRSVLASISQRGSGSGVFDLSIPSANRSFGAIDIASMSQDELSRLLEDRKEFKRKLFADAIYKLEIDSSLADVQPCINVADAASGLCRLTPAQLDEIHASKAQAQPIPQSARAKTASLPQIERKIAVLFGLNDYDEKKIPQLENAIPDVEAVSKIFADKLGYEVRVLRNPKKADIIRTLNQLATEINSSDSVVVYYAGHGYSLDKSGLGYWLPTDASVSDPGGWISNSDVAKLLAGIRSRQMVLISDSCYSGAFARDGMASVGRDVTAEDVLSKRSVVVLSSGGDEPVADEGKEGHSIFAWNLMRAVGNVQNWRPGSTIFTEVQSAVKKEFPQTPRYGSVTSAGHQQGGDYLFELR